MPALRQKPDRRNAKTPSIAKERSGVAQGEVVSIIEIAPYDLSHEFNPHQIAWSVHPSRTDRRTGVVNPRPKSVDVACIEYEMLRQFREGVSKS